MSAHMSDSATVDIGTTVQW